MTTLDPTSTYATAYLTLDPETHRDPQEFYDALGKQQSVYHDPTTGYYLVSHPDAVRDILVDTDRYSSSNGAGPALTAANAYLMSTLTAEQRQHFISPVESIITSDGEAHLRLRRALNPFFTPTAARQRQDGIRASAGVILDGLSTEVDWVQDFCSPLMVHLIADLIGVPDTDFATIRRWNRLLMSLVAGVDLTVNSLNEYIDFTREFTEYFQAAAARARENPDSRLLSHLLNQDVTEHELMQLLFFLFIAGTGTSIETLRHIAVRIAEDTALIDQLRTRPETIPAFVEQCIVELTPTKGSYRVTCHPVTVQGTDIPVGATVLLLLAAANQGISDLSHHVAFGRGTHRCIGQHLARITQQAALEAILERYDKITLTRPLEELPVHPHLVVPSHPNLYVRLHHRKSGA